MAPDDETIIDGNVHGIDLFLPAGYDAAWLAVSVVGLLTVLSVAGVLVVLIVTMVRSARSRATAPGGEKTTQERLAEIDQLHAAGTITPAERDAARARTLDSI